MKRTFLLTLLGAGLALGLTTAPARAGLNLPKPAPHLGEPGWSMTFDDDWQVMGGLPEKALILSLQGLANRARPQLYLVHPPDFQWKITRQLHAFYQQRYALSFTEIATAADALAQFKGYAKGYVVWEQETRTTLNVAFTIAGLEDAVVVTPALIPLVEKAGLKPIDDLRGRYTGKIDLEIYQDAYDRYWRRCNHDAVMLMGGDMGMRLVPAMADIGVAQRMFFQALSANPNYQVPEEVALVQKIYAEMNRDGYVFGWHTYSKDKEEEHVTLTSTYGLKMEGLYNLPNLSFNCHFTVTPGFKYVNHHSVAADAKLPAEKKVYVAYVESDQMGIGKWVSADRGRMPLAWQVPMDWAFLSPAALQYFYETATPNDYIIAGLSGPSYMYPKHLPPQDFTMLMAEARDLMKELDLRVMEILDNSGADGNLGNADLPAAIVDRYYQEFPDAIGFINGYGPAHTRDLRNGQPMISYDLYIDPLRPRAEVLADMNEMIAVNPQRPYFLLVHVRESNDVASLVGMVPHLHGDVEVVPVDKFLKLAASAKTYTTCYEYPDEDRHFKGYENPIPRKQK